MAARKIWRRDTSAFLSFSRDLTDHSKGLKKWDLVVLREQCAAMSVEEHYLAYVNRMHISQLYSFISVLIFITCTHSILLYATLSPRERTNIYFAIAIYLGTSALVILTLSLNFSAYLIKRCTWIPYVTTTFAIMLLVAMDISIPIIEAWWHNITKPLYYSFIIISIYLFMPITKNTFPFILGMVVSVGYVLFYQLLVFRWRSDDSTNMEIPKTISESTFILCINVFGLFVRLTREIVTRMTFLDKRQCIEEKLLFYAAKGQERNLLLSIIPKQIAKQMEEDVKMRIEIMKHARSLGKSLTMDEEVRKLFIEPHDDVTILYADIVNYTYLTTTLDVSSLVATLNDLFVRFDDAAQEFNVLRIQFLGDCYYCVGNVSIPNEQHAKSCVYLGLRMIDEIREVRAGRQLEIDMRIGVHTGSVLSGVIGANKWQFDIYSKDVDIANRLESTGVPGRVHISGETLAQLEKKFKYERGTQMARDDPLLRKYQITTFLIIPFSAIDGSQTSRASMYSKGHSQEEDLHAMTSVERMKTQVNLEMSQESLKMPINSLIGHYKKLFFGARRRVTPLEREVRNLYTNISWIFMWYKNWRWEVSYMQQPDILHKYSVFVAYIIIICTIAMQAINAPQSPLFWVLAVSGNVFVLLILALLWYKKLWTRVISSVFKTMPKSKISLWLYRISDKMQRNYKFETFVYLSLLALQFCLTLEQLFYCDRFKFENEVIEMQVYDEDFEDICFDPWSVTECIILNLGITFLFTHISYVMKWIVALFVIVLYLIVAFVMYDFIFEHSISSNQNFFPEYAHVLLWLVHLLTFHTVTREIEFISRIDHTWKYELRKKKENAKFTNKTISILISNILPSHIVHIYMKDQLTKELYYEQYDNVAVMFATILSYDTEQIGMRVLNEIICDFDRVLSTYRGMNKIEKIKVAGCTYMAACGLSASNPTGSLSQPSPGDENPSDFRLSIFDSFTDNQSVLNSENESRGERMSSLGNDVVYVMLCFALDLLRAMKSFNMEGQVQNEDKSRTLCALRIGISNGPVMAGVVGLYKPFYDVWGNAVNMASRMDSTGRPDSIQVTEETADILKTFDIECNFRGQTYVKGRGYIPTYFVNLDENLSFIRTENTKKDSLSEEM